REVPGGAEDTQRLARDRGRGAHEELDVRGDVLRRRFALRGRFRGRMRLEGEDLGHQVDAQHAVDRRVVHLGDDGDVTVLETLDDPQLPQRAAPIEWTPGDLGRQLGELVEAPRRGYRGPPAVIVEIEVGVLDPARAVDAEGHLDATPPERLETRETVG